MAKKILAMVLAVSLVLCLLSACQPSGDDAASETASPTATPTATPEPTPTPTPEPQPADTMTVAYASVDGEANPFFTDSESGKALLELTQLSLLTTDRSGKAVLHAATGEKRAYQGVDYDYTGLADIDVTANNDGTATYRITLRESITFSDGTPMTADDVIFTYYTLLDPSYTGPWQVAALDISGVDAYRTNTPAELYTEYAALFDEGYDEDGEHTEDVAACVKDAWIQDLKAIQDFCMAEYLTDYAEFTGYSPADIQANEGLQVMFTMWLWGFGKFVEDGQFTGSYTDAMWDLQTTFPTLEDAYNECFTRYEGDCEAYWRVEAVDNTDVVSAARDLFVSRHAAEAEGYAPVTSISGIVRVDDRTVEITTDTYAAGDIYTLCGIYVAPLHHYGDTAQYDPENGKYGFAFGDLSLQQAAGSLGAGAYVVNGYENQTVTLIANPNYYGGIPATPTIRILGAGTRTAEEILSQGLADIAFTDSSEEAAAATGNMEGAILSAMTMPGDSFVYIGINADTVYVDTEEEGDELSEASAALRRALATVLAAGRADACTTWYGNSATVLEYPTTLTDILPAEQQMAYNVNVDGAPLYDESMLAADRLTAAIEAAKGYLTQAGYTWDEEQGIFTEAPEGASLIFTVDYVGGGTGANPCAAMLENAAVALYGIGITLDLNDLSYNTTLREHIAADTHQIWVGELSCKGYEDFYRYFHSNDAADQNYFGLESTTLDELILQIGDMTDDAQTAELYAQAFDVLYSQAVIVPCFMPSSYLVYSSTVDAATLPAGLTAEYPWTREAANILMAPVPYAG